MIESRAGQAAPSATQSSIAAVPSHASILLVDDQPGRLISYEAILATLEVRCVRAISGREALQRLLDEEFAVILLDVRMPEMDGFEVARLIRTHPRIERTPIIFVTADQPNEIDRLRGYEAGAVDFINLPLVPEILRSKVAVLLELHQRRSELQALNEQLAQAREQAEAQQAAVLAEREALLRATFEHPTEMMSLLDAQRDTSGRIVDWIYRSANANTLNLFGLTREALIGHRLSQVLPGRADALSAMCVRVLATREPHRYEASFGERDFLVTVFALGAESVVSSALDITQRKRTETALRQSRERLLLAKTAAGLGTFDWDIRGDGILWDERTHELWGTDPAAPVDYAVFESGLHPDDRARVLDVIRASIDPAGAGDYQVRYRVVNRIDGRTRWVEATGKVQFDDGYATRMLGVVLDVTERVASEDQLRASEQRFRELANTIDQFVWISDSRGHRTWYNERWYRYSGSTFEQMRGLGWKQLHHPDHIERVTMHLEECLRSGQPWEDTFPLRGQDGVYRWFLSRAVPIRDEHGNVVRWLGTNTDITEQRELQDALQQADRRKDEFLAMLAHELRNPVAPIASAAEVLTRLLDGDKERGLADIVRRQAAHLGRLLDDLLDVARITQGRVELRRATIALQSCVDLAVETAEPQIRERGHRLLAPPPAQTLHVHADQARVAQCISNLLGNAAKYTEPGGEIRLRQFAQDGCAVFEVSDTGIGIAPEFLPHMFELFAQGKRGLDRAQGGLGIGLSVCKRLIEMHGGSVAAYSEGLGKGATFALRLPLVGVTETQVPLPASVPRHALRVLVVDDNEDAAQSLALLVELEGQQATLAYTGSEALERAVALRPDVVLLDIGLPDIDGFEVARQLRTLLPATRLVAVTGYGQPEDRRRAMEVGFDKHLVKPLDIAAVREAVSGG
jgi:PAS domain S-box-containing protein